MALLYLEAGKVLKDIYENGVGIRVALYQNRNLDDKLIRKVSGIVHHVIGSDNLLAALLGNAKPTGTRALKSVNLADLGFEIGRSDSMSTYTAAAMVYDLINQGKIQGGGALRKFLQESKEKIIQNYQELKEKYPATSNNSKPTNQGDAEEDSHFERYIRVNRMLKGLTKVDATVINVLKDDLKVDITADPSLADVYKVGKGADHLLVKHTFTQDGTICLQDRGSCLSAICSDIKPGNVVLDVCSAPGSKALHALERMAGKGVLACVERDPLRALTLIKRLKQVSKLDGPFNTSIETPELLSRILDNNTNQAINTLERAGNHVVLRKTGVQEQEIEIHIFVADFLQICQLPELPYPLNIAEIVNIDPSCSGSGLPLHSRGGGSHAHQSVASKNAHEDNRTTKLALFQSRALATALSCLPRVRTVCYSTCSIDHRENEGVVLKVLDGFTNNVTWQPKPCTPKKWDIVDEALIKAAGESAAQDVMALKGDKLAGGEDVDSDKKDKAKSAAKLAKAKKDLEALAMKIARASVRSIPEVHHCRGFYLCRLDRPVAEEGESCLSNRILDEATAEAAAFERAQKRRAGGGNHEVHLTGLAMFLLAVRSPEEPI